MFTVHQQHISQDTFQNSKAGVLNSFQDIQTIYIGFFYFKKQISSFSSLFTKAAYMQNLKKLLKLKKTLLVLEPFGAVFSYACNQTSVHACDFPAHAL